jgi:hypothetical protein
MHASGYEYRLSLKPFFSTGNSQMPLTATSEYWKGHSTGILLLLIIVKKIGNEA